MSQTLAERLADVDAAISSILTGGAEIQTRTGRIKKADLAQLRAERANLERQIAYQNGGPGGFVDCIYERR